jgi:hypothetical protein
VGDTLLYSRPPHKGRSQADRVANIARLAGQRTLRLFVIAGFALTLAACDKCSMPVWRHDTPAAPQSCHDDAPAPQ